MIRAIPFILLLLLIAFVISKIYTFVYGYMHKEDKKIKREVNKINKIK